MSYLTHARFHFEDCDPAGIMFYGRVPILCHRVYENWLLTLNPDWTFWFSNPIWIMPVKNCSVDYMAPMPAGAEYDIELFVSDIGTTSFSTHYLARSTVSGKEYFKCTVIHVFVNKSNFKKMDIPTDIRSQLSTHLKV